MSRVKTVLSRQTLTVGTHYTKSIRVLHDDNISLHYVWEDSPVVVDIVQTSNDPQVERDIAAGTNTASWFVEPGITLASGIDGSSPSTSEMLHIGNVSSGWVRAALTVTTAGTVTIFAVSKED